MGHYCIFTAAVLTVSPTIGARIGHAIAVAEIAESQAALALLDAIPHARIATHQPYWVARAHVLERGGDLADAVEAYTRAIGLTEDAASRRYVVSRKARITG